MKRVLVTGGAGFLGSFLVKELVGKGYDVVVFDNLSKGKKDNLKAVENRIEFVKGDVTDAAAISKVMKDIDIVFHYAALTGTELFYKEPRRVLDINSVGTINVVKESERQNVQKLVFASSSELYGHPLQIPTPEGHPVQVMDARNPRWSYSVSKLLGEVYFFTSKINVLCLRYFNVYGPRMSTTSYSLVMPDLIFKLYSDSEYLEIIGDGKQTRSFCFIDDSIEATMVAFTKFSNDLVNIGNDTNEITILELAKKFMSLTGISKTIKHLPARAGDVPRRCPSIQKLRSVGWSPKTDLETGLTKTLQWYSEVRK